MKITFGIVNCNRLFYLKSCLESLLVSTRDYADKDIIIIDNCSTEEGTDEFLEEKAGEGIKIIRKTERDPRNEFAKGLNLICENATDSDFVCPLQGDMQFTATNWLKSFLSFYSSNPTLIGCLSLDAQRRSRNATSSYAYSGEHGFLYNLGRYPVCGAADVIYSRYIIDKIYPWCEDNLRHEGGSDSETAMLAKVENIIKSEGLRLVHAQPLIPVSCSITTDLESGCNARVSGDERIGDYWAPKKDDYSYYEMVDYDLLVEKYYASKTPVGKEDIINPIGWELPLDEDGNWIKKPHALTR